MFNKDNKFAKIFEPKTFLNLFHLNRQALKFEYIYY